MCWPIARAGAVASTSGDSSVVAPNSTGKGWTMSCTMSPCATKGRLCLRQVTRLREGGHRTNVITSRWDLRDIEVAYRMFQRWRQKNFFKYMREEFLLDALVDYQIEPEDPTRTIPKPERRALDKEIRAARADVARLECDLGAAAAND